MGNSGTTYADRVEYLRANKWSQFRRGLRLEDQDRFDEVWDATEKYVEAGGNLNPKDIEPAVFMSMLLEQQRRIDKLEETVDKLDG